MTFFFFAGLVVVWLLIVLISVYNKCMGLEVQITEQVTNVESIKIKLNNAYSEIYKLLEKYSIHESDIMKAVASGQANLQILASRYPQLRADTIFQNASQDYNKLFSELQDGVFSYNRRITEYNIYVTNFPRVLFCLVINRRAKNHAKIS